MEELLSHLKCCQYMYIVGHQELPPTSVARCLIISFTAALRRESDCCCNLLMCSFKSLHKYVSMNVGFMMMCGNERTVRHEFTCNGAHCILILCMPVSEAEGDTTFSCTKHSLLKRVPCRPYRVGKVPSPCGSLDIGSVAIGIERHAPRDQAFSSTASINIKSYLS